MQILETKHLAFANKVAYLYCMRRETVIVVYDLNEVEVFADLRTACEAKGWGYSSLSKMKKPFLYDRKVIDRKNIVR